MSGAKLRFRSVFVTGATGFVGRYFVDALVRALPADARVVAAGFGQSGQVDLLDHACVTAAIAEARPDLIFHLAAQSSVGSSLGDGAATWRVNVGGTLNLAQAVVSEAPDAMFAFVSTSEVYGASFNAGIADERTALAPLSAYARSKRAAEDVLSDVLAPSNRLIVFRPTNHSGPGQDARFVLPSFAQQIAEIEAGLRPPVLNVGSLIAERDFLDVRDVVGAYIATLSCPATDRIEILNVASGSPVSIGYLLERLRALANVPVVVERDPERMRPSEVPRAAVDAQKIRAKTGWSPSIPLDDTILAVLESYRQKYV